MKYLKRVTALLLMMVMLSALVGCSFSKEKKAPKEPDYSAGDNVTFVENVVHAANRGIDRGSLLYDGSENPLIDLGAEPALEPYFYFQNFKAQADVQDPALVHYSCEIPGLVSSCFNMAYNTNIFKSARYSKPVAVEGDVRVLTDADGSRHIDISGADNAFYAYASLRYMNPLLFMLQDIDTSDGFTAEQYAEGLNLIFNVGSEAYAAVLGADAQEYTETTVIPELGDVQAHMGKMLRSANANMRFGPLMRIARLPDVLAAAIVVGTILGGIVLIVLIVTLPRQIVPKVKTWRNTHRFRTLLTNKKDGKTMLEFAYSRDREVFLKAMNQDDKVHKSEDDLLRIFISGYTTHSTSMKESNSAMYDKWHLESFMDHCLNAIRPLGQYELDFSTRAAVILAEKPWNSDKVIRFLCKNIHLGYHTEFGGSSEDGKYREKIITIAGWSAAALGRILAKKMTPADIAPNRQKLNAAIERYNADLSVLREKETGIRELQRKYEEIPESEARKKNNTLAEIKLARSSLEEQQKRLGRGLGNYMLDSGDLPLGYLDSILRDSQSGVPRFLKQGVIMGLVDWLSANATHPDASAMLQNLVAVRADLIRNSSELTFFELRAPADTNKEDYAVLLADVLHCANPSLKYCDTKQLLNIAQENIPNVMEMLSACPLRLIDPANQRTLGFYAFKPYAHAMWVRYVPPQGEGQVISRYHEVDDRTLPLSSGLNLRLFLDPYAVIPTIYHENEHFHGDRNEASVFLKTQLFSTGFYKKYKKANAKADPIFTRLGSMLGMPPETGKVEELNSLIQSCYGKQLTEEAAEERAETELQGINETVEWINAQETWDPSVKMPRLSPEEDAKNQKLIHDIVVRFATVPKSITREEFTQIVRHHG